jgi:hypothetical protein
VEPLRNAFVHGGQRVAGHHILRDAAKQPGRANEEQDADRQMKAQIRRGRDAAHKEVPLWSESPAHGH